MGACTMTASGRSSLPRDPGQVDQQRVGFLADDARPCRKRRAQPADQIGRGQPGQRLRPFLGRQHDDRRGRLRRAAASSACACSTREEQPAQVALEQIGVQAGFLGRALDEAAALAVAREIERVQVEPRRRTPSTAARP